MDRIADRVNVSAAEADVIEALRLREIVRANNAALSDETIDESKWFPESSSNGHDDSCNSNRNNNVETTSD